MEFSTPQKGFSQQATDKHKVESHNDSVVRRGGKTFLWRGGLFIFKGLWAVFGTIVGVVLELFAKLLLGDVKINDVQERRFGLVKEKEVSSKTLDWMYGRTSWVQLL